MMNFKNIGGPSESTAAQQAAAAAAAPLARQLSVYSLTFDEFQSTLGGPIRDFGSMNMDEFLRNIWTAEESQAMATAIGGGSAGNSSATAVTPPPLQKQGSLTLPRTLSQKTVDEVWRELLRESSTIDGSAPSPSGLPEKQREPTLGEMTLEEFLVRAGVVREEPVQNPIISTSIHTNNHSNNVPTVPTVSNGANSIFFGELPNTNNVNPGLSLGFAQNSGRNQIPSNSGLNLVKRGYPDSGIGNGLIPGSVSVTVAGVGSPDGLGKGNGDLSSLSPVPYIFGSGMRGRKCSGAVEKVVERRQRRMIKNRESAARSRARKQAYTMELEAEVAKLKEQNQELQKKQAEIMEMQKNQVMELLNQQRGPKKLCLRRTQTGPW